jgi:hypothetical protein
MNALGKEQADKARAELTRAISQIRQMLASQRLISIMNLAHSLSETSSREKDRPPSSQ